MEGQRGVHLHVAAADGVRVREVFDTDLALKRKERALRQPREGADFLMRRVAEDLADRLSAVERKFASAATLFCLTGQARAAIAATGKAEVITRVEASERLASEGGVAAPSETIPFEPASLDLAVSLLSLQEMNDVPGVLAQIRQALRPDGLFLGAMIGGGTLNELRESLLVAESEIYGGTSPRVSPFADIRDVGGLLQRAGFTLPVTDVEAVTVRYADMFALMRDLRDMGVTNSMHDRLRRPTGRRLFLRAAEVYADRFSDADHRIRATFSIIWMSGWAPDPGQQKPLRPGSAQVSLAETLGKIEESFE